MPPCHPVQPVQSPCTVCTVTLYSDCIAPGSCPPGLPEPSLVLSLGREREWAVAVRLGGCTLSNTGPWGETNTDTAGLACDTLLRYGAGHLTSTNITRYFVKSQYSRQNTRTPAQELLSLSSSTSSCQSVQYWPVTS